MGQIGISFHHFTRFHLLTNPKQKTLPCIVTDINGCNEIIVSGENGVIIPPKDKEALQAAMLRLMEHPEEREHLAGNARRMIEERYEQKRLWGEIAKTYEVLLNIEH